MLRKIRIPVQLGFLLLFLYLLIRTLGTGEDSLGSPVRIFLEIDPLVGLTTWLRTGALHGLLALSGITILLSFLLGRFFCGWVCPLGTLSQITARIARPRREERTSDSWRPSQRWKYLVLGAVVAGSLAGSLWTGLLDPLCLLIRSLTVGFAPPLERILRGGAALLASGPLGTLSEPAYRWLRDNTLAPRAPSYEQSALMASILLLLLALSWVRRRFWCRVLCPLGALLGAVARVGTLRLRQSESACSGCTLCTFHCQGAADPDRMGGWRPSECFVCGNCTASCAREGLSFGFGRPRLSAIFPSDWVRRTKPATTATIGGIEVGRRRLLIAIGIGAISGPIGRASPSRGQPPASLIRPPGAGTEYEFLDKCVRCGECMKVCPGNGLHPIALEAGPLALWTPALRFAHGYCEYHCTLCGQVCPTGAIPLLSQREKERTVVGLAYVDVPLCLPYAYATPCIVCEEHCPTSPKAITLVEAEVRGFDGAQKSVRQPRVDPHLCVGCGICEYRCPVEGDAAIRVYATGRTGEGGPFDFSLSRAAPRGRETEEIA
ncbi:MAG: 4Fe-4S binding protein [Candidatus Eisenbacteria bacterium]|nr:4Fe-4S binding protein [Candidatus Eisenbacteria bacterium]